MHCPHIDTHDTIVTPQLNEAPEFGEDYPLLCTTLAEGPPNMIDYAWSKDGKNLNESDKYVLKGNFLIIKV